MLEQITYLTSKTSEESSLQKLADVLTQAGLAVHKEREGYSVISKQWTPEMIIGLLDAEKISREDYRIWLEFRRAWGYL